MRTTWTDANGTTVSGARFADELDEGETLVSSNVWLRSAEAYWSVGSWQALSPANVPLQLIAQSDLTGLSVDDEIVVAIYRNGERMNAPETATFVAISETREVTGSIDDSGEVRITLPEAGNWILRSSHDEAVEDAGPEFAEFSGRIETITFTATIALEIGQ